jgi:hypothetical protein
VVEEQSPRSTHEVITRQLLVPSKPDRLFELYVGFELIDELESQGFRQSFYRIVPNRIFPFARMRRGAEEIDIWYQRSLWSVIGDLDGGYYATVLAAAGMSKSSLRPDFVLLRRPEKRILLVEAKFTEVEDHTPDRAGIRDVLAYLHDASEPLASIPSPRAMVAGWNSGGRPAESDVVVTDQGHIREAMRLVLHQWSPAASS